MDFSLSGLASGFDWKTFVNQIMAVQNAPIDRIRAQEQVNLDKNSALSNLGTQLTALQASATALAAPALFSGRQVTSTTPNSTWSAVAATGTASGSYQIAVSRLATTARFNGTSNISNGLNTTSDVSGLTLATLPTATAVTAGTFSVNGKKVTVALTDSLAQVFTAISTATSGAVTASYDPTADKITLNGGSTEIVLGAANDTSNFLNALKLANNTTPTITSSGRLAALNTTAVLTGARLKTAITAVDPSGNGTFSINGVNIAYNVNTDTLSGIMANINQSTAGVTASYDGNNNRIVLANNVTGDSGISLTEAAGGLMDALGLSTGAIVRGQNAQFAINGGATLTSSSNTLDSAVTGITGLSVTVDTEATQTMAVNGNTTSMRAAIQDFIAKFNGVQSVITNNTAITKKSTTVTTAVLSGNREVQDWSSKLRSLVFASVPGLTGTISRLEHLGIDFTKGTNLLAVTDSGKLDSALNNKAGDVAAFFQTTTTGLANSLISYTTTLGTLNTKQQTDLTASNTDLDRQIGDLQRRLDQQRAILTSSFIAMESAQSQLKNQSAALTKAFP